MSSPVSIPLLALGVALLGGCAATAQSSSVAPERSDCSFRSATTCWTIAGRFPAPRAETRDSVPDELLNQPTVLASEADTARAKGD
jgi:hypothetical protein